MNIFTVDSRWRAGVRPALHWFSHSGCWIWGFFFICKLHQKSNPQPVGQHTTGCSVNPHGRIAQLQSRVFIVPWLSHVEVWKLTRASNLSLQLTTSLWSVPSDSRSCNIPKSAKLNQVVMATWIIKCVINSLKLEIITMKYKDLLNDFKPIYSSK